MGYLSIRPHQKKALRAIASISTDKFTGISSNLINQAKPSIRASGLLDAVRELSNDEDFSTALCAQLISLATFRRVEKMETVGVFDLLFEGIKQAEFSEDETCWFDTTRDSFVDLLDSECVALPAKALYLSTDFDQLYASANVVTDVRPVFDGDRASVAGALVAQTLQIRFVGGNGSAEEQQVSLALDLDDIEKLIAELEKAKQKAQCAKERFGADTGAEIFIIGEETYGFS